MRRRRDESALVRGAQRGSASDVEALFRLHWARAHRAAYLVVGDAGAAEDIAQEGFLAAVRNLDRFDRRRPFGPWLHRIVVNRAIDHARARALRRETELGETLAGPPTAEPPNGTLRAAIAALPPDQRAVVVLRHLLEYTPGEIAELLELPRGTVNSRLRRGLEALEGSGLVKRELERIEIPGEHEARERAWSLVQAAYAERERLPRERSRLVPIVVAAALVVAVAAALSPPGRAVLGEVRDVVLPTRVEHARPALFSLPSSGRVLAVSDAGAWAIGRDGSRRLLGRYREASRSPFGRFVVASRRNELAALEADGDVRWTLARPDVRYPRWGGTREDTRIAYLTTTRLHVVAGDGEDDVDAGGLPAAAPVPPAWRPGSSHVVAYADARGRVTAYDAEAGALLFRARPSSDPVALAWSQQGRLAIATRDDIVILSGSGRRLKRLPVPGTTAVAFAPDGRLAVLGRNDVSVWQPDFSRVSGLFRGAGRLAGLAWSPEGDWLLVGWPTADQWLFLSASGRGRIEAVSHVSAQLRSQSFPRIEGWCC